MDHCRIGLVRGQIFVYPKHRECICVHLLLRHILQVILKPYFLKWNHKPYGGQEIPNKLYQKSILLSAFSFLSHQLLCGFLVYIEIHELLHKNWFFLDMQTLMICKTSLWIDSSKPIPCTPPLLFLGMITNIPQVKAVGIFPWKQSWIILTVVSHLWRAEGKPAS